MEFCEGGRIDDKDAMKRNGIDVSIISKRLGEIFSEMIFINGFVHADPHPGNLLINPIKGSKTGNSTDFELVIIDHGLYQVFFFNSCWDTFV
jgi:aarF domain-containing kinase